MSDLLMAAELQELRQKTEQLEKQAQLLWEITKLSNESLDLDYFLTRALETICNHTGAFIGQFWMVNNEEEVMTCSSSWFSSVSVSDFRKGSLERRFSKGIGLPGKVWAIGSTVSMPDVQDESAMAFTRRKLAAKYGIKGALGFPLKNGPFLIGMFEFFHAEYSTITAQESAFYERLGTYIGTYMRQRGADHELRSQEALYRTVLDHAYSGFIGIDAKGVVNVWNKSAETLLGWAKEDVLGKQIADFLIPARYREAHIKGMFRHNAGGPPKVSNNVVRTPALRADGTETIVDMYIFPLQIGEHKNFGAFIASATPIERKPDIVLD